MAPVGSYLTGLPILHSKKSYQHSLVAIRALLDEHDLLKYIESDLPAPVDPTAFLRAVAKGPSLSAYDIVINISFVRIGEQSGPEDQQVPGVACFSLFDLYLQTFSHSAEEIFRKIVKSSKGCPLKKHKTGGRAVGSFLSLTYVSFEEGIRQ
ncbi:uncharacterized protein GLRG_00001 [Colletotrichum graminicola M1.001]|uniref:Uncharacterized protein n=1 Tax=Colletotrichum graminicola (strain M1.001 / M2 / FGSC 10212) TaxID=645133 RepID=E3Q2M8_COLGM|nr:uncharacterized protein GLRG_00001 [Colletotrichum graminicola M1.001]EFQ24857.1 hypothetical protein GLRG_00001 [Colletotrichum graminicola M1.001]